GEGKHGITVAGDISHFLGGGVGVQSDVYGSSGMNPQESPQILPVIIPYADDMLTSFEAESDHTQRELFDLFVGFLPGEFFPDAKLFLAQGNLFVATLL